MRSNSNDADNEESDDDADDGDYEIGEGEDTDLADELQELNRESEDFDKGLKNAKRTMPKVPKSRKRRREEGLGICEEPRLDVSRREDNQYVGEYYNPLLDQYYKDEPVLGRRQSEKQNDSLRARGTETLPGRSTSKYILPSRRSSSASLKSVRFEDEEFETPATIRQPSDSQAEDDEDFEDDISVTTDSTESNKENVHPGAKTRRSKIVHAEKEEVWCSI